MPRNQASVLTYDPGPDSSDRRETEEAQPVTVEELLHRGYRFALSLTHDPARAEDLLQDAWVSVLRARGPHTVGYLFSAVRCRFVDHQRRALIAPTESLDSKPRLVAEIESEFWNDPSESISTKAALHRALGLLRPEERAVLMLSAVEGYTAREIGRLLNAPRGTVLSLMHRTRAKMRRWLPDHPDGEDS